MNPHYRDIAFLLSLGGLPLACGEKEPADTNDTTGSPPLTDPGPTTSGTTDDTTTATNSTTDDTTTGPPVDVCQASADNQVECVPGYAGYADLLVEYCKEYIAEGLAADGPACAAAIESYFACFSQLPCSVFTEEEEQCVPETVALEAACPSFNQEEPPSSDTGTDEGADGSDASGSLSEIPDDTDISGTT